MKQIFRLILSVFLIAGVSTTLLGCDKNKESEEEHSVVESGTYTGTVKEVVPEENEIYVTAEGKELELYFIEKTKLTREGEKVEFSALEKGQKVEVELKKVGKRLDPLSVKILD
jgi:hypothetical protein